MSFVKKQDDIDRLREKLKDIDGHNSRKPVNTAIKHALLNALSKNNKQPNCS